MRYIVCALSLGLVVHTAAAQQPAAVTLKTPDAEYSEPFTRVSAIRELASRKVYVSDISDKTVVLVDLDADKGQKVGREGKGPGEYSFPNALIPIPGNGTLLQDMINRRFLHLGADGKPGDFLMMPTPSATTQAPGGGGFSFGGLGGITNIRGVDGQGRIYFEGMPFGPDGQSMDSTPAMRWDRVKPAFDTVGWIHLPKNSGSMTRGGSGSNQTVAIRIGSNDPFVAQEVWSVGPDGRLAIVSPEPYRVTWVTGRGARSAGPVVPYTPIRVTEAEKKVVRDRQARQRPTSISIGGGGGSAPSGTSTRNSTITAPDPEWPETMPPFTPGPGGGASPTVLVSPEGDVWVHRTRKASEKNPVYDVFDSAGKLVKRVTLNPDSRVVGFGQGVVYVVRADEDDLQYLQRFKR